MSCADDRQREEAGHMGSSFTGHTHLLPQTQASHPSTGMPLRGFYRMHFVKCFRGWCGLGVECLHLKKCLGKDCRNFNVLNKLGLNRILTTRAENSFSFFPPGSPRYSFLRNTFRWKVLFWKMELPRKKIKDIWWAWRTWEVGNKSNVDWLSVVYERGREIIWSQFMLCLWKQALSVTLHHILENTGRPTFHWPLFKLLSFLPNS